MKLVKKIAVLSSLAAALVSPLAEAAEAWASLDFSHMTVTTYGSLTYNLFTGSGYSSASGTANGASGSTDTFSGGVLSINNAGASFSANLDGAYSSIGASVTSGTANGWGWTSGGQVELSGNGVVVFSIPYTVALTASETGADASSWVALSLSGYDSNGGWMNSSNGVNHWAGFGNTEYFKDGTLTLAHYFGGGTSTFDLYASTNISANVPAVPEPESYAMFLAGLGIIGAVARRRAAKA